MVYTSTIQMAWCCVSFVACRSVQTWPFNLFDHSVCFDWSSVDTSLCDRGLVFYLAAVGNSEENYHHWLAHLWFSTSTFIRLLAILLYGHKSPYAYIRSSQFSLLSIDGGGGITWFWGREDLYGYLGKCILYKITHQHGLPLTSFPMSWSIDLCHGWVLACSMAYLPTVPLPFSSWISMYGLRRCRFAYLSVGLSCI